MTIRAGEVRSAPLPAAVLPKRIDPGLPLDLAVLGLRPAGAVKLIETRGSAQVEVRAGMITERGFAPVAVLLDLMVDRFAYGLPYRLRFAGAFAAAPARAAAPASPRALFRRSAARRSCFQRPLPGCVPPEELFADQFAFWATGDAHAASGYGDPPLADPVEFGSLPLSNFACRLGDADDPARKRGWPERIALAWTRWSSMAAAMWTYFIPLYVLGGLLLLFGAFALLARVRGGRYVRPVIALISKVPLFRRWMTKAWKASLERQNPALASAVEKLERAGVGRDPQRAQAALSRLTAAERRAYLEAAGEQGMMPEPTNRAERRRLEKLQKKTQR